MRILPMALYQYSTCDADGEHLEQLLKPVHLVSSLTHGHEVGLICCGLFSLTLREWPFNEDIGKTRMEIEQSAFEKREKTIIRWEGFPEGDTDSNAAVAGVMAGIFYGKEDIPKEWFPKLKNKHLIERVSSKFAKILFGNKKEVTEIDSFAGEYAFLAMKAFADFTLDDVLCKNIAAAYLAQAVGEKYR